MSFDDDIGDGVSDLLEEAGGSFIYCRGNQTTTITMRKSTQPPVEVDIGTGSVVEVHRVDFLCLVAAFPYTEPERGDTIRSGGNIWEAGPIGGEKCYRQISPKMLRIHAKRTK